MRMVEKHMRLTRALTFVGAINSVSLILDNSRVEAQTKAASGKNALSEAAVAGNAGSNDKKL
jgi:hypothetical protein